MLGSGTIEEIERLLAMGGLSQREIAGLVGVSLGTVNSVARGRKRTRVRRSVDRESYDVAALMPARRCKRCGYQVYPPCRICRARDEVVRHGGRMPSANRRRRSEGLRSANRRPRHAA